MAYNEIISLKDDNNVELTVSVVELNIDKKIYLLHVFKEDNIERKKYTRNKLVFVNNQILTSRFSDTIHFFEELNLFDSGNSQNKYLDVTEYKNTKNLKLKNQNDENIFISKSEAKAMHKLFNMTFSGYSVSTVLENEFKFTAQVLTKLLHENKLLSNS